MLSNVNFYLFVMILYLSFPDLWKIMEKFLIPVFYIIGLKNVGKVVVSCKFLYLFIYIRRRLFFTTPTDARGGTTERELALTDLRPGFPRKFPKEFPTSGREFLGPKSARPPPGEKNAPAFGRGRLVVSEYAGKVDF